MSDSRFLVLADGRAINTFADPEVAILVARDAGPTARP